MNIFNRIGAFFMSLFNQYNIESVTEIKTNISGEMLAKIDLWNAILAGRAPWQNEAKPCGVVETVIGKLANSVNEEMEVSSESEKLEIAIKKLNESNKEIIQNIVALGGCIVRPNYKNNKIQFEIIKVGNYIPTRYDLDGLLLACIITKKISDGKNDFILLELHDYNPAAHTHTIKNELYKIVGSTLKKTSLDASQITAGLPGGYVYNDVKEPLIIEFRNREPNRVDGSNIPCALWQNTENLIEDADRQYNRINWEQEGGEMRVFADEDLFRDTQNNGRKGDGFKRLDPRLNKLIVKLSGNGTQEEKITTHAPALRTDSQINALNEILRRIETTWNIGKGTLSDLSDAIQTATQYRGGSKALYNMIDSLESELEEKYRNVAYAFAYLLALFDDEKFNDEILITYNEASRKDAEAVRAAALSEVQNNIISREEYRVRVFGEDEATAAAKVPAENVSAGVGGMFDFSR